MLREVFASNRIRRNNVPIQCAAKCKRVMTPATESVRSHQQYRVLCVDDNDLSVSINAIILRKKGYEVLACSDPLRAASIAESEELDLAILDYEMPVMNGAELAALCKAANPQIKVILFTGSVSISSRELPFADLVIQKSDGVEALLDAINALLTQTKSASSLGFDNS